MLLMLNSEKEEKILESRKGFLGRDSFTITELSSLIETLTSTFTGNKSGPLYYRELDKWIKHLFSVSKKLQYYMLRKLFTVMHQCMGGGNSVKESQKEDHGLTQKRVDI